MKKTEFLRPFNPKTIQPGDPITNCEGRAEWTFVGLGSVVTNVLNEQSVCVRHASGSLSIAQQDNLRETPLTWIDDYPVYEGDRLIGKGNRWIYTARKDGAHPEDPGAPVLPFHGAHDGFSVVIASPTSGWLNVTAVSAHEFATTCVLHRTREAADNNATSDRLACVFVDWSDQV